MRKSKKGFTLVELLVVIAIIAIIAAVAVPVTIGQIEKSKIKTAKNEMQNITEAINTAYGELSAETGATYANNGEYLDAFAAAVTISGAEYVKEFKIVGSKVEFTLTDAALSTKVTTGNADALKYDLTFTAVVSGNTQLQNKVFTVTGATVAKK